MNPTLQRLRDLAGSIAGSLPRADALASLSTAEETEAMRVLGGIRSLVSESISLLASDIERKSGRGLGTDGLAQKNGFKDGAGLVQNLLGVDRREAAKLIRVGELLETAQTLAPKESSPVDQRPPTPPKRSLDVLRALPGVWDAPIAVALSHGWVTAAHADTLRSSLGAPRGEEARPVWREAVLELIGNCWSGQWCPEDLARAAKRVRACLDGVAAQADAARRYEQRSFRRFVRASGMVHYDIEVDPESDARVFGPIKRLLSPRFGGPRFTSEPDIAAAAELVADPRTNDQLQLDTLVELIDRGVAADDGKLFKTNEPQVMVAVTADELRKAHAAAEASRAGISAGAAPGIVPGTDAGIAWIDGLDHPITALDAQRMICAGGFTPALFDETGRAIDIGKDQRYFTQKQRRAMAKRDGGCLFPGCDRPPSDCEGHHINPWAESVANHRSEVRDGVLLCRRHHKMIHDHGAHIERQGSTYWLHWPGKNPVLLRSKAGVQTQLKTARRIA